MGYLVSGKLNRGFGLCNVAENAAKNIDRLPLFRSDQARARKTGAMTSQAKGLRKTCSAATRAGRNRGE
ncbi:hypothetical protein [Tropicibacter oceani]|uniref:Uncharacterized protein n=1 Tax=Tropicibacter oceani TaxID=3058420 RepID=A0ABY8QIX0_9RHOB|nr:hypothetical protein [Tropicibacter oceani]WGW03938.1 hypothetical protein QF118_18800 [Tropicibacter oceani]